MHQLSCLYLSVPSLIFKLHQSNFEALRTSLRHVPPHILERDNFGYYFFYYLSSIVYHVNVCFVSFTLLFLSRLNDELLNFTVHTRRWLINPVLGVLTHHYIATNIQNEWSIYSIGNYVRYFYFFVLIRSDSHGCLSTETYLFALISYHKFIHTLLGMF